MYSDSEYKDINDNKSYLLDLINQNSFEHLLSESDD
jgi:hypothetical protein